MSNVSNVSRYDSVPFNTARDGKVILMNPDISNDFLHIYYAGITLPNPAFRVHHNINNQNAYHMYTFEYILAGSGYIEADGKRLRVTRGDLFFLHRDRPQIYYSDPNDPFQKIFIALCGDLVDHLVAAYGIHESALVTKYDCEEEFYRLFDMLGNRQMNPDQVALLLHLFIQKLKPPELKKTADTADTPAKQIREYINTHLQSNLSLSDIASYFNISESTVIRIFKREYGISPIQHLLNQRMKKAAFFLRQTDLQVGEIAEMFGYDSKTFSKRFSQVIGCSPRQYRAGYL